ncbi:hypothetical protein HYN48_10820 [Flavobacterium magnum]|uniref:Lipoprotein n=1 Tax=Flavobacterium magnum TaxID=2162713 RepID=A0A2S0RII7_9FLAO|nr:hypothetical protein [Flavobacterium magnum]AWA30542.1 hypothetical protein HYN48_10820 [Flavobacterium magnum]
MRTLLIGCLICLSLLACKVKKNVAKFVRVDPTEVNTASKNRAYELGKRILVSCNTSRFKPFNTSEATAEIIKNITPEKITKTCQKFLIKYGRFQDLKLAQVLQNRSNNSLIFRYKADYQWKHTVRELRVTVNSDGKVSAIKSANWTEDYTP